MNQYWGNRADNINQAAENRNTEEGCRQEKRTDKPPKSSKPTCPAPLLEQHFTGHFKLRPEPAADDLKDPSKLNILPKLDIQIDDSCPTTDEVTKTVKFLKNGRCLGSDGVAGEYLKYAETPKVVELMTTLFERIWTEMECPEAWKTSRLKALYKNKGSKMDAAMHRALMINSTIYKVLMMIILDRARPHYEASILPSQYGFRANKATTDGVFVARQVIKKVESEIFGYTITSGYGTYSIVNGRFLTP